MKGELNHQKDMLEVRNKVKAGLTIRLLNEQDDVQELTTLLNTAYKSLADMGFAYWASYQNADDTRRRCSLGECYIALLDGNVVGTVLYKPQAKAAGNPWYNQSFVASVGQFAVAPQYQRQGLGNKLMDLAERNAMRDGATELALDTAEGAAHLIEYYKKRRYRFIDYVQWERTNYRSVILSKRI